MEPARCAHYTGGPAPSLKSTAMKKNLFPILLCCLFTLVFSIKALSQSKGPSLQAAAEAAYDRAYTTEKPADQAKAFDEAASLFEKAAKAYRAEGQEEKAKSASNMAGLARQNAAHRRQMSEAAFFGPMGSLASPNYKLYSPKQARFCLLPEAGITFQNQESMEAFDGGGIDPLRQSLYSDPALMEHLFEKLGGEFLIGSYSKPATLDGFHCERSIYKGFSGGVQLSPQWQLDGSAGFNKSHITASFPMTAFQSETPEPYSFNGQLRTELRHTVASLGASYFLCTGAFRPFAGLGLHFSAVKPGVTAASIEGVSFPLETHEAYHSFGPYLAGGIAWQPGRPFLLRIVGKGYVADGPKGEHRWNGLVAMGLGVFF